MPKKSKTKFIKSNFQFTSEELYSKVCGINDSEINILEKTLSITIIPRGRSLILEGSQVNVEKALYFFKNLSENYQSRPDKTDFDTFDLHYLRKTDHQPQGNSNWIPKDKILTTFQGKSIYPRTSNQELLFQSLVNNYITIAIGPAGTGKTYLTIAVACRLLQHGEVDKIVLTRPAVEAGESLGFLPGDMTQKVDPYLKPVYDALYDCIGYEKVQELIAINKIEIAPIAFMRGRTLSNSYIVLDEAQNCTISQLKMFMTRLGKNSRMSLSGDITQVDLAKHLSGLERVITMFMNTDGIGVIRLNKMDITRHPLVELIVNKFEEI